MKIVPVMLLFCPIKTQSFVHYKSSSNSQFINIKSRNLQKLLRYLSGIVTSTYNVGTSGRLAYPLFSGLLLYFLLFLFYN